MTCVCERPTCPRSKQSVLWRLVLKGTASLSSKFHKAEGPYFMFSFDSSFLSSATDLTGAHPQSTGFCWHRNYNVLQKIGTAFVS